jgi:hypothetical protein
MTAPAASSSLSAMPYHGNQSDQPSSFETEEALRFKQEVQGHRIVGGGGATNDDDDEEDEYGPKPLSAMKDTADGSNKMNYGGALRPGEGEAIAQFVQQNMRIPRRGEIGWRAEEIEGLETHGYVMSGSRHARMNAVRLRKENQVYSAEEKRALALISFEEKQQKENKVVGEFRQMLSQRMRAADAPDQSQQGGNE